MTTAMIFRTIFEILLVGFTIWGLFHEERFVAFERKIISAFRRSRLKTVKGNYTSRKKCA